MKVCVMTDLEGVRRPQGSGFDQGAYEYHITAIPVITARGEIVISALLSILVLCRIRFRETVIPIKSFQKPD